MITVTIIRYHIISLAIFCMTKQKFLLISFSRSLFSSYPGRLGNVTTPFIHIISFLVYHLCYKKVHGV